MIRAAGGILSAMHILFALLLAAQMEHHDHSHSAERLGTVSFATSCKPEVQADFTRAVALLHSFWYEEAEKTFRRVAAADPQCGMAWWGVAMTNYHPVWPTAYSPAELERGKAAVEKAIAVGAKTPREKAYIDAVAELYRDPRAYEAAMEKLVAKFPDDDEASIFYGLMLINHGMALPTDKTYEWQKKAAVIFNRLLPKHPDHPGISHYVIHSFDYPALAPLALDAAHAYAKIAPSSPHALHMPSHIFVRLGMWPETIASNIASDKAARDYAARERPGTASRDGLHATDYLAYAWLQRGEDDKVQRAVDEIATITKVSEENFAAYYAIAAVPARFALERRQWKEAAALQVRPADFPWDRYGYAEAMTHFARAVGAARMNDLSTARAAVARLQEIRSKQTGYWGGQIDIQSRAAEAWIARAESRNDDALKLLQSAADLEDSMDKSPVTPGPILPAREMLGDLLLELGRPADALVAYERSLKDSPNRLNGLSGAARAAELSGERGKARGYYQQIAKLF
jgi:tetratricopeptide (TPR) repeat protein